MKKRNVIRKVDISNVYLTILHNKKSSLVLKTILFPEIKSGCMWDCWYVSTEGEL